MSFINELMKKDELKTYKDARMDFLTLVQEFPENKRTEKLFSDWSLRDILVHIAAWEGYTIDVLDDVVAGNEPYYVEDSEEFNQNAVEEGKNTTWEDAHSDMLETGSIFIESYSSLDDTLWDAQIWDKYDYTLREMLKTNTEHYVVHKKDIETVLSGLKS